MIHTGDLQAAPTSTLDFSANHSLSHTAALLDYFRQARLSEVISLLNESTGDNCALRT
jgi:hypothetical protein